jgi:hypothetical protein
MCRPLVVKRHQSRIAFLDYVQVDVVFVGGVLRPIRDVPKVGRVVVWEKPIIIRSRSFSLFQTLILLGLQGAVIMYGDRATSVCCVADFQLETEIRLKKLVGLIGG